MSNEISTLRAKCPLVQAITNYVTVNDVANAILAIGGSPVMADYEKEVEDFVRLADALLINVGTLTDGEILGMHKAGVKANELGVPVVFDPVGAGAGPGRNKTVMELLKDVHFAAIKGNLSEMAFIAGRDVVTRGVDSSMDEKAADPVEIARICSEKYNTVVAITGKVDTVCYKGRIARIYSGSPMMGRITGTGCMLGGVISAFVGALEDPFVATASALGSMGAAGKIAEERAKDLGTGSFRTFLIDALSMMDDGKLSKYGLVEYEG